MPTPAFLLLIYQARQLILGRGLAVLGAWALGNLLVSGYQLPRTDKRGRSHYFHQMNVAWGAINTALATWGILGLRRVPLGPLTLGGEFREQLYNENLFLFNTGLDVAYIVVGLWLHARAISPAAERPERLAGFGCSLWVQGGFLLVFDAVMWGLMHGLGRTLLAAVA